MPKRARSDHRALSVPRDRGGGKHLHPRPADFDAQRYARQAFGITSGEKPIKVRLLFAPKDGVHQVGRVMKPAVGSAEIRELLGGAGPIIELVRCD